MPVFNNGKTITSVEWGRLIQSIPTTYTIWYDSANSLYRAECNLSNGADYNDEDASTVFGYVFDQIAASGSVFINKANYSLSSKITLNPTGKVFILSNYATIIPPNNDFAFEIDSNFQADEELHKNVLISGLKFDGSTSTSGSGIKIVDTYHCVLEHLIMRHVNTGILVADDTSWSEGTVIKDIGMCHVLTGIKFDSTNGTGSFINSTLESIGMELTDTNAVGLHITSDANVSFSDFVNLSFWSYESSQTQLLIEGNADRATFRNLYCESFVSSPSNLIAIKLNYSYNTIPVFIPEPAIYGNFTTKFSNPNNKNFVIHGTEIYEEVTNHTNPTVSFPFNGLRVVQYASGTNSHRVYYYSNGSWRYEDLT